MMNKKIREKMILNRDKKKRLKWKMLLGIYKGNGNGFRRLGSFWLRRERRERKAKRRRSETSNNFNIKLHSNNI